MTSMRVVYVCQLCGEETHVWLDRCPECMYPCYTERRLPAAEYCLRYGHQLPGEKPALPEGYACPNCELKVLS